MRFQFSILVLSLALAGVANAGVYVETAEREAKGGKVTAMQRMWLQGGVLRMETGGTITLWKGDAFTMIDPREKTYTVMDRATLKQLGAQLGGAMAEMDAQLANMSPEQRAMVERMMGGNMPGKNAAMKIEAVDTGRAEVVDGRSCRLWDVKRNGAMHQRHCVVAYGTLPGKEDFQSLFKKMAALAEDMREAMPQVDLEMDSAELAKLNGYPVLTRDYKNGKPSGAERRMTVWREEAVAAEKFQVPAGYEKREFAAKMGPR